MADNNIGKPLTMVEKVTDPNANTNVIINDNGYVHQAAVNDLLKNSDVNTSLENVRKTTVANMIKQTLPTITQYGITCINNGDGTYTINGTSTIEENDFYFIHDDNLLTVGTKYKYLCLSSNIYSYIANDKYYNETGNGIIFTASNTLFKAFFRCGKGITYNNLILKPMLTTNLSATYDDFVPYTGDTGALNTDVADIKNTLANYEKELAKNYLGIEIRVALSRSSSDGTWLVCTFPEYVKKYCNITLVRFGQWGNESLTSTTCDFDGSCTYFIHSDSAFDNNIFLAAIFNITLKS